jgi:hypothetical protein
MISLATARKLLDFRRNTPWIPKRVAEEHLQGAVALHNILQTNRAAYLADEVGMGKTYVALGTLALFRHFNPEFRLLVIAPRENIQRKWIKELKNFVANNIQFSDLRVKALHGVPARPVVACSNLLDLIRETSLNPDRDFFIRLTSFSLPLGRDPEGWRRKRDELLKLLPWMDRAAFDLRDKEEFKAQFARAICTALPEFDLVIVDEGHNLKHGFGENVSARNKVLARAFGHPEERTKGFRSYGPRARRILFLSATPLEDDYRQLWNQLNVFGLGSQEIDLKDNSISEEKKRVCAQSFLIRRVTSMDVAGKRLTKNLYRREWHNGGVENYDDPLKVPDERQRLIVALAQKKVSEILGHERFNNSFQIGMLASFESFLETAKVKPVDEDETIATFDDADQTDDIDERLGIDVDAINSMARSYRKRFGTEPPHPKMDALVQELSANFRGGNKALVFVRRVASVKELEKKLEEKYDAYLFERLRSELIPGPREKLTKAIELYQQERQARRARQLMQDNVQDVSVEEEGSLLPIAPAERDTGGLDTFFVWFFRGEGPDGFLSGAALQRRFAQPRSAYSTFFEDNYVAWLLKAQPGNVLVALAQYLGESTKIVRDRLIEHAPQFLPKAASETKIGRYDLFTALQKAAIVLIRSSEGCLGDNATLIHQMIFNGERGTGQSGHLPANVERWLEEPTFFTELCKRPGLRDRLWPQFPNNDFVQELRERELRRHLLSATARLGHAFIDLYVLTVNRLGSIDVGARKESEESPGQDLIADYLDLLERQMARGAEDFRAFTELSKSAEHFDLILNVNMPDLRKADLRDAARAFGVLLGRQQPVGGMFGTVNQTLVRQFRMPGYPLILVTTDLLQEGEDLHTFCSSVYHYGISWMPSSMEQRIGRIDRVNSETERRLSKLIVDPHGGEMLQVYFPHLRDTVEVLQVERVLERMKRFVLLMHKDLGQSEGERKQVDLEYEMLRFHRDLKQISEPLESAFPIREELLQGQDLPLAITPADAAKLRERFLRIKLSEFGDLKIEWEDFAHEDALIGTVRRNGRQQPFTLFLRSFDCRLMLRCVSPIGRFDQGYDVAKLSELSFKMPVQLNPTRDENHNVNRLLVEQEALLSDEEYDIERVRQLINAVTASADSLEEQLLPGSDAPLSDFRTELEGEPDNVD